MSLDNLFQQIIFTEQLLSEKTTKLQEVKVSVVRYEEKIKASNEKLTKNNQELFNKTQQLYEMKLQNDLMKKQEQQTERQLKELLCQQGHLKEHLDRIRTEASEEQEQFLEEIGRFNNCFSLVGNRESVTESQAQAEILQLQGEVDSIHKEMELEHQKNGRINSLLEENKALLVELKDLENINKDLDRQITEAKGVTESLREESVTVSLKPQTDSTCMRLKKEQELLKEGDLELVRKALSLEIRFLQSVSTTLCVGHYVNSMHVVITLCFNLVF
ncbi:coiled-coil domain-containing protein 172 isoform X1 [Gadus macrocephalus]|uniref:coiled-coil domain-containing protein 172 isoform X1 n=1 Tax=Gadus macrocephalus TaxID=80720 RepID=UPI0028CBA44D|nr:coiled-coil domain-containing protein 172 isoform X1 [Gadus macrocephalus]